MESKMDLEDEEIIPMEQNKYNEQLDFGATFEFQNMDSKKEISLKKDKFLQGCKKNSFKINNNNNISSVKFINNVNNINTNT